MSTTGDKVKAGMHAAAEKTKDAVHHVGEKIGDFTHKVAEKTKDAVHHVGEKIRHPGR